MNITPMKLRIKAQNEKSSSKTLAVLGAVLVRLSAVAVMPGPIGIPEVPAFYVPGVPNAMSEIYRWKGR